MILQTASVCYLKAEKILAEYNFSEGNWEMIGITLHNYHPVDLQKTLGTFIIKDKETILKIQENWDFDAYYSEHCDYHYALKLYKDQELVQTLRVNLHCNYISTGIFTYQFDPELLAALKSKAVPISWSRIRFQDITNMRIAIRKLKSEKDVYMYHDVKPYEYDGYFVIGKNNLDWGANKDSIQKIVVQQLIEALGTDHFYIQPFLMHMTETDKMALRFEVYCDEHIAKKYEYDDITAEWRSHTAYNDFLQLIVIGTNKERFMQIVSSNN
jgi:hypothetical protein